MSTHLVWESFPAGKVILVSHESSPWMDLDLIHNVEDTYRDSRSKFVLCSPQAVAWLPLASDRERWEWKPSSFLRLFYLSLAFYLYYSLRRLYCNCVLLVCCSILLLFSSFQPFKLCHYSHGLCPAALSTGISGEIVNEDLQVSLIGWRLTLIKLLRCKGSWYIMSHGLCWPVQEVSAQLIQRGYLVVIGAINPWKAFLSLPFLLLICNIPRKGAQCVGRYLHFFWHLWLYFSICTYLKLHRLV